MYLDSWGSHAPMLDGMAHVHWLAEQGIKAPLRRVQEDSRQQEKEEAKHQAWISKMPTVLRPRWEALCAAYGVSASPVGSFKRQVKLVWGDLLARYSQRKAIRMLFAWFSYGQGPWHSGVSIEELITQELLFCVPTKILIRALQSKRATRRQLEGAARFFSSWEMRQKHPDDLALLPAGLQLRLWRCTKKVAYKDNRRYAQYFE